MQARGQRKETIPGAASPVFIQNASFANARRHVGPVKRLQDDQRACSDALCWTESGLYIGIALGHAQVLRWKTQGSACDQLVGADEEENQISGPV